MKTPDGPALLTRLNAHLEDGGRAVGYAGTPFPVELAEALGLVAVPLLELGHARDPEIELAWIDDKEDPDVRSVFVRAMRGDFAALSGMVSTRAMDHVYYYLREAVRLGAWSEPVPLHMFDLMHLRGDGYGNYNRASMRRLVAFLERIAGCSLERSALDAAVLRANVRRAALRDAANERIAAARGKRLLLVASAPLNDATLVDLAEGASWSVVAVEDGSGRLNPGDDLVLDGDPLDAIADYYAAVPMATSHPRQDRTASIDRIVADGTVDGVLFWMHRGDQRLGWDFPPLRDRIEARGIPVAMIRSDLDTDAGRDAVSKAASALLVRAA